MATSERADRVVPSRLEFIGCRSTGACIERGIRVGCGGMRGARSDTAGKRRTSPHLIDLARVMAEDLQQWPNDGWLVIDDYQAIARSIASDEFVAR